MNRKMSMGIAYHQTFDMLLKQEERDNKMYSVALF